MDIELPFERCGHADGKPSSMHERLTVAVARLDVANRIRRRWTSISGSLPRELSKRFASGSRSFKT
jgi:hypothetical protein